MQTIAVAIALTHQRFGPMVFAFDKTIRNARRQKVKEPIACIHGKEHTINAPVKPLHRRVSGGDGGESNPPSKRTYRRMYYRHSRCFYFSSWSPTDRIPGRWPSGLRWRLEDGHRHSSSMFFDARTRPHGAKAGRTVRHWLLSSESVRGVVVFGN